MEKLKKEKPQYTPQLILFDGNGVLHNNGCGLASHMGVLLDIPSIGASKTIFFVDGITKAALKDKCRIEFEKYISIFISNNLNIINCFTLIEVLKRLR